MKNIHVLPTDKPSRLVKQKYDTIDRLCLADIATKRAEYKRFNIYITSDEFIEEVDFGLHLSTKKIVQYDGIKGLDSYYKKIILTTDQDLIKDGVQAIDDEFLEWFLNNQSCDSVEVKDISMQYHEEGYSEYKIIIPKEEQTKCYCGHTTYCDCGPLEEPKQETLEEVAEIDLTNLCYYDKRNPDCTADDEDIEDHKKSLLKKNKTCSCDNCFYGKSKLTEQLIWQQEKMYSEEEVKKIIKLSCEQGMLIQRTINDKVKIPYTRIKDFTIKMFEQFKKL